MTRSATFQRKEQFPGLLESPLTVCSAKKSAAHSQLKIFLTFRFLAFTSISLQSINTFDWHNCTLFRVQNQFVFFTLWFQWLNNALEWVIVARYYLHVVPVTPKLAHSDENSGRSYTITMKNGQTVEPCETPVVTKNGQQNDWIIFATCVPLWR